MKIFSHRIDVVIQSIVSRSFLVAFALINSYPLIREPWNWNFNDAIFIPVLRNSVEGVRLSDFAGAVSACLGDGLLPHCLLIMIGRFGIEKSTLEKLCHHPIIRRLYIL